MHKAKGRRSGGELYKYKVEDKKPDQRMLSALLRPFFKGSSSRAEDHADLEQDIVFRPSIAEYHRHLHATADFTEADDDDEESVDGEQSRPARGTRTEEDEDGLARSAGLLPLFSADHLDSLPVYSLTHAIRSIVQARTEATLSLEQLRSPQVFQFLIKPMLQQIRAQHFSPATLYALLANCLQFKKEGQTYPGTAGTSGTRARVCELLAIKLLKEYTTRELVDALCYDFYPSRAFQAIWNGAISFLPNREDPPSRASASGAAGSNQFRRQSTVRTPLLGEQRTKEEPARFLAPPGRRSVVLYDPRTASPFKLSRLRVPRYRRIISICSLAVLIFLFLAVLGQRSTRITSLELLFWFWSAGCMLDEIVGFSEQGVSFYVMNLWNIFDLGILLLLIVYYCMRIYGVFLLDPHRWNQNAYDVLAVNAILLLPRIFSVLDHCRYFSRLLIALRLLAVDLAAVFALSLICCSGFFVFFVSSNSPDDPFALAYRMFQIFVGFTPSAWEMWPSYNWMGKILMGLFLVISHFIILTMFITVLTNSFMSIAPRACQEYQFTFAINTISMAKNDALFSYVAPGNIFAWALMPLKFCISQERYVRLNRAAIKVTHFPLLLCIYLYERYFLAPDMYEPTDLVDKPHRGRQHPFADPASRSVFIGPSIRVREQSVLGYHKDRALEEVFRLAPDMRTQRRNDRRTTQTAIRTRMDQHDAGFNSPKNYSTVDSRVGSHWYRRPSMNRGGPSRFSKHYSDVRSAASDPADLILDAPFPPLPMATDLYNDGIARRDYAFDTKDINTDGDADGDDELVTNDEEEDNATNTLDESGVAGEAAIDEDYFTTPITARFTSSAELATDSPRPATSRRVPLHTRTLSTNTILYAPKEDTRPGSSSSASAWPVSRPFSRPISTRPTPVATPTRADGRRSPRRSLYLASRPRSMIEPGDITAPRTAPSSNRASLTLEIPTNASSNPQARRRSLAHHLLDDDMLGALDDDTNALSAPPSITAHNHNRNNGDSSGSGSSSRITKLMLAKMKTLEDSLGDMAREMRTLRRRRSAHDVLDRAAVVTGDGRGSGDVAATKDPDRVRRR
ncbi:4a3d1dda-dbba-4b4f-b835-99480bc5d645 [Thermothielavioides terrestris]|uniref:4a3d1dda-dbba-4b4f-b835-99480bc5d645 n=1 Tax=Thermothielavioides terrestris TaxID=2587410 RepID=A0A3S4D614_9PEZI|nr:4a3d1dda-dbba-4b4f-b835-99480bc5d645 [Thermothielavioides terrestris]